MNKHTIEYQQAELLASYLLPLTMTVADVDQEGETFTDDQRWFSEHPDRKLMLRLARSQEYSPEWYALHTGAFGDESTIGLSDDFLPLLDREPKRLVAVHQLNATTLSRTVVWLGPLKEEISREWTLSQVRAVVCHSDGEAEKLIAEFLRMGNGDEPYCVAWLAEFATALSNSPVWQARRRFFALNNSKAN